jgi:hydrogenase maturation protease
MKQVTILGVGNILLTDEGIGVYVVKELERNYSFPSNVELYDGGTGGLGLLSLIEKTDHLIIVDSVLVEEPPGTVVKFDFEDLPPRLKRKLSAHETDIIDVLQIAEALDKRPPTTIFGIQPRDISTFSTELSIKDRIPEIIELILKELRNFGLEVVPRKMSKSN